MIIKMMNGDVLGELDVNNITLFDLKVLICMLFEEKGKKCYTPLLRLFNGKKQMIRIEEITDMILAVNYTTPVNIATHGGLEGLRYEMQLER